MQIFIFIYAVQTIHFQLDFQNYTIISQYFNYIVTAFSISPVFLQKIDDSINYIILVLLIFFLLSVFVYWAIRTWVENNDL